MNSSKKRNFFHTVKKWLVAGTATVATLCLLCGMALCSSTVQATGETGFTTKNLVQASHTSNTKVTPTTEGVTISSDGTYEAYINGVFDMDENVGIHFDWAMADLAVTGKVVFRLTDVANATNYVDIVYKNNPTINKWTSTDITNATNAGYDVSQYTTSDSRFSNGVSYVQWGDEIRSTNPGGAQIYNLVNNTYQNAYPVFTVDPYQEEKQKDGTIQLLWDKDGSGKDVLTVTVAGNNSGSLIQRVRARFDGTYNTNETNNGFVYDSSTLSNCRWGLPYIDFSDGYTISVISETGTDVELKTITVGGDVTYTYQSKSNNTLHRLATLISGGNEYDLTTTESMEEPSFYQPYVSYASDVRSIPLDVVANTENTIVDNTTGIGSVVSAPEGTTYGGEFPIRFKDTTVIEFAFPEQQTENIGNVEFAFTVLNAIGEEQFSVVYNANGYTNCWVEYNDEIRSYGNGNSSLGWGVHYWYNTKPTGDKSFFAPQMGWRGNYLTQSATLTLEYDTDGVMSVKAIYAKDNTRKEVTIAQFDGSAEGFTAPEAGVINEADFETYGWGLPKLDLSAGYSIKFSCENTKNVPVNFISVDSDSYTPVVSFGSGTSEIEAEYKGKYTLPAYAGTLATDEQFVGWLNKADNKLYKVGTTIENVRVNAEYEAMTLVYKMKEGASMRIVSGENTESGIRFESAYDETGYAKISSFVKSKGTLITLREYLDANEATAEGQFIVENAGTLFSQESVMENTKPTYADNKTAGFSGYALYSVAINSMNEQYATTKLTARGYIQIEYADGSTGYIYTDWTQEKNVRSLAEVAYKCKTKNDGVYEGFTSGQKGVIDYFADMYQES